MKKVFPGKALFIISIVIIQPSEEAIHQAQIIEINL